MVAAVSQSIHPEVFKPTPSQEAKRAQAAWAFGEFGADPKINLAAALSTQAVVSALGHEIVSATSAISDKMQEDREFDAQELEKRKKVARKPQTIRQPQDFKVAQAPRLIHQAKAATPEHGPATIAKPDHYDPNAWKFYILLVTRPV